MLDVLRDRDVTFDLHAINTNIFVTSPRQEVRDVVVLKTTVLVSTAQKQWRF